MRGCSAGLAGEITCSCSQKDPEKGSRGRARKATPPAGKVWLVIGKESGNTCTEARPKGFTQSVSVSEANYRDVVGGMHRARRACFYQGIIGIWMDVSSRYSGHPGSPFHLVLRPPSPCKYPAIDSRRMMRLDSILSAEINAPDGLMVDFLQGNHAPSMTKPSFQELTKIQAGYPAFL